MTSTSVFLRGSALFGLKELLAEFNNDLDGSVNINASNDLGSDLDSGLDFNVDVEISTDLEVNNKRDVDFEVLDGSLQVGVDVSANVGDDLGQLNLELSLGLDDNGLDGGRKLGFGDLAVRVQLCKFIEDLFKFDFDLCKDLGVQLGVQLGLDLGCCCKDRKIT